MTLDGPKKTVIAALSVVVFMGGLAWAAVPLYGLFCRVTGYGGETGVANAGPDVILDKTLMVRLDASLDRGMP